MASPPPEFVNSGSTSSPPSAYGTTGTFIESNGQVTMTGANAAAASLSASDPFLGDIARLLTNTTPTLNQRSENRSELQRHRDL